MMATPGGRPAHRPSPGGSTPAGAALPPPGLGLRPQPFDAGFLGGPVWRLDAGPAFGADQVRAVEAWAGQAGAVLVAARVAPGLDAAFAGSRFRRVETLVTLERPPATGPDPLPPGIRPATRADAEACAAIAAASFRDDRYHADPATAHAADAMKAAWARNNATGRADAGFVAMRGGAVAGFNFCLLDGAAAIIDLIATAPPWRGRGIGRALVAAALAHYSGRARRVRVGTQATNRPSLALYRAMGFVETGRASTWHLTMETWPCGP